MVTPYSSVTKYLAFGRQYVTGGQEKNGALACVASAPKKTSQVRKLAQSSGHLACDFLLLGLRGTAGKMTAIGQFPNEIAVATTSFESVSKID